MSDDRELGEVESAGASRPTGDASPGPLIADHHIPGGVVWSADMSPLDFLVAQIDALGELADRDDEMRPDVIAVQARMLRGVAALRQRMELTPELLVEDVDWVQDHMGEWRQVPPTASPGPLSELLVELDSAIGWVERQDTPCPDWDGLLEQAARGLALPDGAEHGSRSPHSTGAGPRSNGWSRRSPRSWPPLIQGDGNRG